MIAGHSFTDTPAGRVCLGCGKRWADIAGTTLDDVGKPDIAHIGALSEQEANEIIAERDRIWSAVAEVAGL